MNHYQADDFKEFIVDEHNMNPSALTTKELEDLYQMWKKLWDEAN